MDSTAGQRPQPFPPARTAWYAVGVIALVNMLDNVDRGIISLLIEPIKRDLALSDTEISLLIGLAFSLFYGLVGLPMSRFADTRNRKYILSFGIFVWSAATAACAFATGFKSLFAMRGLTGAGVSLKGPCALSMISDLVPRHKYPTAISIFNFGIVLGSATSLIIGGTLIGMFDGQTFSLPLGIVLKDWQMIFLLVGAPGILVALLVMLTVREPARRGRERTAKPPVLDVFRYLWRERTIYAPFYIGVALIQIETMGLLNWRVPFFSRTYGWGPEVIGPLMGTISILLTPIGLVGGAWLGERMAARDPGAMIKLSIMGTDISLPLTIAGLLMPTPELALTFSAIAVVVIGIGSPGAVAALQTVTPNEYRGQLTALHLFTIAVIGGGLGPVAVALFTDYIFQDELQLRYAMASCAAIFGGIGLALQLMGLKPYTRRVAHIMAEERAAAQS